MIKEPIMICASGNSVSEGINKGLFSCLQSHYSIGLNYWYKFGCETTFNSFCDSKFYIDNVKELSELGLIVGKIEPQLSNQRKELIQENTILLPSGRLYSGMKSLDLHDNKCQKCSTIFDVSNLNEWPRRCPNCRSRYTYSNGIYGHHLVGMFSLTLAIVLGFENIYLLGYDCCEVNGKTHFYQDNLVHHGVGKLNGNYKTSTYNNVANLNNERFGPYKEELNRISIKNVSLDSQISIFPKITYDQFYSEIGIGNINQQEARKNIREYITHKIS